MSDAFRSDGLIWQLRKLLPQAPLSVKSEMPWHSLTVAGTLFGVSAIVSGKDHRQEVVAFTRKLPKHEFMLDSQFVAEIAVIESVADETETRLTIAALLLAKD